MPAKITVAGAKTYKTFIIDLDSRFETYQADAPRDSRGKCVKNVQLVPTILSIFHRYYEICRILGFDLEG